MITMSIASIPNAVIGFGEGIITVSGNKKSQKNIRTQEKAAPTEKNSTLCERFLLTPTMTATLVVAASKPKTISCENMNDLICWRPYNSFGIHPYYLLGLGFKSHNA
jgi:hypothetical protein